MSLHKPTVFSGAATALITPFTHGRIDYEALGALIDLQISGGVNALLVAGTTGESATLTLEEHRALTAFAKDRIAGRVPLLAGCGSNSTAHAIELAKAVCEAGADALLAVTPYYNKTSDLGLIAHYTALANAAPRPLILYDVPARTGMRISLAVYRALAVHENIVAVKEASGDLGLLEQLCDACGDLLDVYTGNDHQTVTAMKLGAVGVISVCSNLFPREVSELCRLCLAGEFRQANGRMRELLPKMQALFWEVNPIPVKYVAALRGLCAAEYRLPLCPPSPEIARKLQSLFYSTERF